MKIMENLKLNVMERINLLKILEVGESGLQERKVLDNLLPKIEFSNLEIQQADIYKKGKLYNKEKDFEKEIELVDIESTTLKNDVIRFADEQKCVTGLNKNLFYKIDDLCQK